MPTFHPAYLLRDPSKKKETWEDLKTVMAALRDMGLTPPSPSA
jgi:DNA polymerase